MEFNDHQAIYLQIAERFCENILLEEVEARRPYSLGERNGRGYRSKL